MQSPFSWLLFEGNPLGVHHRKRNAALLIAVLVVSLFSAAVAAPKAASVRSMPYPIVLFGDRLNVNLGAVIEEEIYLPLRQMAALLGLQVDFCDNTIQVRTPPEAVPAEAVSLQALSGSNLSAIPSLFPLYIEGERIEPNPAVLIEGHTYLPLQVFSDCLGIEASFADNMVLLGDYASLADGPLPLASVEAAKPVTAGTKQATVTSERFSEWDAERSYQITSLQDFQQLIELMADHLGTEAKIRVSDEELASQLVRYLSGYTPERLNGIGLQINNNVGRVSVGYHSADEVRAAMRKPNLVLSAEAAALQAALQKGVEEVIRPEMSAYEQEKAIHDYLVRHIEYDLAVVGRTEPHASSTAYGALVLGKAVCGGYAEAFKLFMDLLGIECYVVVGSGDGIPHAWNMVELDGDYYHIDVTWDDPLLYDDVTGQRFQGSKPNYNYFNLSDDLLALDHSWEPADYPAANGQKYRLTRFYSDRESLIADIVAALSRGEDTVSGRCLFLSNSATERRELLNHIMEKVGGGYGVRTIGVSWDEHKAMQFTFSLE